MSTYSRFFPIVALLVLSTFGLNSCGSTKQYGEAMKAFSQGAAADNFVAFGAEIPDELTSLETLYPGVTPAENPRSAYQKSLDMLNGALQKPDLLKEGNLLAPAYVLRGMSNWRLANYSAARQDAAQARTLFRNSDPAQAPRDYPLAYALDDLANLDSIREAYTALIDKRPAESAATATHASFYRQLKTFYEKHATATGEGVMSWQQSLINLDRTIEMHSRDENLTRYLRNVQMTVLRNWAGSIDDLQIAGQLGEVFRNEDSEADFLESERDTRFPAIRNAAMNKLAESLPGGKNNMVYGFWDSKF